MNITDNSEKSRRASSSPSRERSLMWEQVEKFSLNFSFPVVASLEILGLKSRSGKEILSSSLLLSLKTHVSLSSPLDILIYFEAHLLVFLFPWLPQECCIFHAWTFNACLCEFPFAWTSISCCFRDIPFSLVLRRQEVKSDISLSFDSSNLSCRLN